EDVFDLTSAVRGRDRDANGSHPLNGKPRRNQIGTVRHHECDSIRRLHTSSGQLPGHGEHATSKLAVRNGFVPKEDGGPARCRPRAVNQFVGEVERGWVAQTGRFVDDIGPERARRKVVVDEMGPSRITIGLINGYRTLFTHLYTLDAIGDR